VNSGGWPVRGIAPCAAGAHFFIAPAALALKPSQ